MMVFGNHRCTVCMHVLLHYDMDDQLLLTASHREEIAPILQENGKLIILLSCL